MLVLVQTPSAPALPLLQRRERIEFRNAHTGASVEQVLPQPPHLLVLEDAPLLQLRTGQRHVGLLALQLPQVFLHRRQLPLQLRLSAPLVVPAPLLLPEECFLGLQRHSKLLPSPHQPLQLGLPLSELILFASQLFPQLHSASEILVVPSCSCSCSSLFLQISEFRGGFDLLFQLESPASRSRLAALQCRHFLNVLGQLCGQHLRLSPACALSWHEF